MMYARMPELDPAERLAHLPVIVPSSVRTVPQFAGDADITRFVITSLEGRPVFRVAAQGRTQMSYADSGDAVTAVDRQHALRIAREFAGRDPVRFDARLTDADQW